MQPSDEIEQPTAPAGLDADEAGRRRLRFGRNEMPQPPRRGHWAILREVLAEPMFLLLVLAAGLYLLLGDPAEGLLLAGFAALSVGLVVLQQQRSERALEALRALSAPTARVLREGREQVLAAAELVPGDLVLLGEGERVAADAWVRDAQGLRVDESLLTGESQPVGKRPLRSGERAGWLAGGEDQPVLFASTLVVSGHALAQVSRTGSSTEAGRIGVSLARIVPERTLLQQSVNRLVRTLGLLAAAVSAAVFVLHALHSGDWIEAALAAIAVAMALLPEEFPMAFAVFMALGAWRLAQIHVLVRRPAVVETLGAATVLCVDKTGTLTENRMRLRALQDAEGNGLDLRGDETTLPEHLHGLLEHAVLASKRQAFDPMDLALNEAGASTLASTEHLHAEWPLQREYGLNTELLAVSRVWQRDDGSRIVASKGAPEAIAELCRLDADAHARLLARVEALAARGLRVLAVASAELQGEPPENPRQLHFSLHGLLGFQDPLRASAAAAVAEARQAGIRVLMITGDFPSTAAAIAAEAGLDAGAGVVSGPELEAMDAATLARRVGEVQVFARIRPEQKLRLVEALKAQGEVVAMTGDGVNDAPALKAAHIGLAMARGGTDVAREAAAISLLDDDIGHIVAGVRTGRRIFDNLRKVLIYIIAIHVPVAGLALLPLLLGLPPLLLPMHVVLIEMVVDPICAIAFESEPEEADIMRRSPRQAAEPLLGPGQIALGVVQGLLLLAACLALFLVGRAAGLAEEGARTLAFVALTAGNLALVRINGARGATLPRLFERGHRAFWIVAAVATAIVSLCLTVPALARLFGFGQVSAGWLAIAIACGWLSTLSFDLLKRSQRVRRSLGGGGRD